ncbi:MAG: GNAT family N-acetyltransferase [Ruminococcus sp.]|jgi:GNAT superfamily N-acetyltransferase
MNAMIKTIEDLSLNAWPSHQIQIYDGWLLRFSYFYTHRTNSVEQIGISTIPIDDKIEYCQQIYQKWGTPAIFKISPLVDRIFDRELERRGYTIEHTTQVMVMDLESFYDTSLSPEGMRIENSISPQWIEGLFELKGTTNAMHRKIVPSMYQAIPKDTIAASIYHDGKIIATGLGILDREYIGLYAIHVHPDFRGRGYAFALCSAILTAGKKCGARKSYLQVVAGNQPAENLYRRLGFHPLYIYWFRVLPLF